MMNPENPNDLEPSLLHAAAFRGLGQNIPGPIPRRVWPVAKIIVICFSILFFCIPGLACSGGSILCLVLYSPMESDAALALVLASFFGIGWMAIGAAFCYFTKN
jgi:hypothetical protein